MFKTGNPFIDSFSRVLILLPLLPAGIVFLRRIYRHEILNLLMILCLLNFGENIGYLVPGLTNSSHSILRNIFSLLDLILYTRLFGFGLDPKYKNIMNLFLVAFLSVFITWLALKGMEKRPVGLDAAQHAIILLLTFPALFSLIRSDSPNIFRSPLLWITAGTFFYFSIALLMEVMGNCCVEWQEAIDAQKMAFIDIACVVKYALYALAALFYEPRWSKEPEEPLGM